MRKVAFQLPKVGSVEAKAQSNQHLQQQHPSFKASRLTTRHSYFDNKKVSKMEARANREAQRSRCLTYVREAVQRASTKSSLHKSQIETLLSEREFCSNLFNLFDESSQGFLIQDDWISHLKNTCSTSDENDEEHRKDQEKLDLIELLEAVTYLVCQDNHVVPDTFYKIWSSRGVVTKLMRCIDKDVDDTTTVEEFMSFVITVTNPLKKGVLNEENIAWLEQVFRENVGRGKEEFTLEEFKKIVPSRNEFFVERAFRIFDKDGSGTVSLAEFIETMHQFSGQGDDEKISFLFKVYDLNDDGLIDESDLREVMKACMLENGMEFDEKEVSDLANALFEDAVKEGCAGITVDDLKDQLQRHEGLLENLTISIGKWLVPPKPSSIPRQSWCQMLSEKLPHHFSASYWRNNRPFLAFLYFIILFNLGFMAQRAYYFRDFAMLSGMTPNPFYMLSRAAGRGLLINSIIIIVLVLRYCITFLRRMGLAHKLPLDQNIYFHKFVGWLIFALSWVHTVMHLLNFGINIQPNPVKFLQLNNAHWIEIASNWTMVGYNSPPGCNIVPRESNLTQLCDPDSFDTIWPRNVTITHCEACDPELEGAKWSYTEWLLTPYPGVFGMPGGWANVTGVSLITVVTVMVMGSLSIVRRSGYFQVFYFTHFLYWAFWGLLIIHAPNFYKSATPFLILFIIEFVYRILNSFLGRGKTLVSAGVILPSRVTHLIIKRPAGFNFSPGDWVFIKIPAVAKFEWHPFTISSAPEVHDTFHVHIRGVGEWTNRLYKHFEEEYERQLAGMYSGQRENKVEKFRGTVRAKYDNARTIMSKSIKVKPTEDADFVSLAEKYTVDKDKQKERIQRREDKLKQLSHSLSQDGSFKEDPEDSNNNNNDESDNTISCPEETSSPNEPANANANVRPPGFNKRFLKSLRYLRQEPTVIKYDTGSNSSIEVPAGLLYDDGIERFELMVSDAGELRNRKVSHYDGPGKRAKLNKPLEIYVDGPFGSPSSNIYRAEHAVLIGTGIGITPFASILQSIMHRYWQVKKKCPKCEYQWSDDISTSMFSLRKVDFFWINRDQKSFEWFVKLLSQLEIEQAEHGGAMSRFLDMHMYVTSALQRTDMKAVGLQLALDLLHEKEKRDLVTGLKARTNAGRPNWNKVFTKIKEQRKGKVTVYFCGNQSLSRILKLKCDEFGFTFKKESF